jgi:CAAX protease family protein
VNSLFIPWDFALVLLFLGVIVPWRGNLRVKRLLAKPQLTSSDRLRLYWSTIILQWVIVAVIAVLCARRSVSLEELGLAIAHPIRIFGVAVTLTGVLCVNQIFGLRKIMGLPAERRGSLFSLSQKIMPHTRRETFIYALLAATAGVSEEFIYRGFVFLCFIRMIVNYGSPSIAAAVFSSVWFAVAHIYQGRRGIITTFVVGLIFACTRIWTASLIAAAVAHFGMDLTIGVCVSRFLGGAARNAQ